MSRQRQLERCGWHFVRIRESEYRANNTSALSELWLALEARGVSTGSFSSSHTTQKAIETDVAHRTSGLSETPTASKEPEQALLEDLMLPEPQSRHSDLPLFETSTESGDSEMVESHVERYGLEDISESKIRKRKPVCLIVNGEEITTATWVELILAFVHFLVIEGHLTRDMLPIRNARGSRGKYMINTTPEHELATKTGQWKQVDGIYVDTLYGGSDHIKNMVSLAQKLGFHTNLVYIDFK